MRSGRRGFVGQVLGAVAAAGTFAAVPDTAAAESPMGPGEGPPWLEEQEKQAWDTAWVDRVTGRYRQVFDAPEMEQGTLLHQARSFLQGFIDVYGMKDSELSAVLVIRHAAIPMAANDRLWDELELGKAFKIKDPESGKPARRNPFLNANTPRNAKYGMLWPDGGLDTLLSRGAIGLCCNLALFQLVGMIAKREKVENKAARDKVLANLVPGLIVQPSGIFAVARAEAAGCQYIRAS